MDKTQIGSFEITRYKAEMVNGEPKIIIEQVRVNDTNGQYMKFAKLKEVAPYLSKYPVTFKPLS